MEAVGAPQAAVGSRPAIVFQNIPPNQRLTSIKKKPEADWLRTSI